MQPPLSDGGVGTTASGGGNRWDSHGIPFGGMGDDQDPRPKTSFSRSLESSGIHGFYSIIIDIHYVL